MLTRRLCRFLGLLFALSLFGQSHSFCISTDGRLGCPDFDLINYVGARRGRLNTFKQDVAARGLRGDALSSEWSSYTGRERVLLRKRRTKLQLSGFHIITQVGQGG